VSELFSRVKKTIVKTDYHMKVTKNNHRWIGRLENWKIIPFPYNYATA